MSGVRAVMSLALALAGFAACQKDSLQPDGSGGIKPFPDGGPGNSGAAGTTGAFDGGFAGFGFAGSFGNAGSGGSGGAIAIFGPSECVVTSLQLPWTTVSGSVTRFEVVTSGDAIAVLNRQSSQLDVRTYRRDGTVLGGRQFAPDVQVLAYGGDHFLFIAHGVSGDFVATDLPPTLEEGIRVVMAGSTATERVRAAVNLPGGSLILLTTERFVNMTTGVAVPWTTSLGLDAAAAFTSGRVYGVTQRGGEILVAGGSGSSLGLMVLDTAGNVVRSGIDTQALNSLTADTTTTLPVERGLLMFDGNPPRFTEIGFDLSRFVLGANMWLLTFEQSAPRVVALNMPLPIGIWLTVYPDNVNAQGTASHDLYGCVFDFTNRTSCAGTFLIARTGIAGYDVALAPVAAAAFADQRYFAVAHSDANRRTWLRITDAMCRPNGGLN